MEAGGPSDRDGAPVRFVGALLAIYVVFWTLMAFVPLDRSAWAMENVLVWVFVPGLVWTYRRFAFSRMSYFLLFVGLCAHAIGAHYTYSEVPYDAWSRRWLGVSIDSMFGFERNHYDRIAHFGYGLLISYPIMEVLRRRTALGSWWSCVVAIELVISTSALFEIMEWATAALSTRELGTDYVGMQGDIWDAQKDMALAASGAGLTMGIVLWLRFGRWGVRRGRLALERRAARRAAMRPNETAGLRPPTAERRRRRRLGVTGREL